VTDVSSDHSDQAALLMDRLANPVLVALLLAKTATAAERGVALRLSPASVLTTDVGNPGDLVSIVGNLVDNAVDATAGLAGAWVQVQIREAEDRLTVVVADSGPGIPAERRGAVFDLGWSTKHSPAGARRGLGLALVRQVVQRCAGTVAVRDGAEGRGAIFEVTLPLSGAPSPERSQLLGSAP
jgi:two-component system CitB family sensor kinase